MFATMLTLMLGVCDLGTEFAGDAGWNTPGETFVSAHAADGFKFASDKGDVANCMRRGACAWHGLEVWEARLYYKGGAAEKVELSLYNRGDDKGPEGLSAEGLKTLLDKAAAAAEPGGKIGANPEKRKLRNGGFQFVRRFTKGENDVELAWGVNGAKAKDLTADYVRVTVVRKGAARSSRPVAGVVSSAKAKANVVRNDEGDVWIDNVPMVDQGQKGYCACAVSERVLRYYGKDVDEHQIAQMAGSTAGGGTSIAEMIETVRTVGSRNRLGFQSVVSMTGSVKDINKDVEQYNKAAKSMGEPTIDIASCTKGNCIMIGMIDERMKSDVILKMRMKDSRYKRFLDGVRKQIDLGVPVFWGVTLGKFPEPEIPQASGGHMRLIIGYNKTKHKIIYSDTWGAGHERKTMDEDKAFAITHDAFYLKPL